LASTKAVISKRTVDAMTAPALGEPEARLWDTKLTGFFVRIRPTPDPAKAKRVYSLKYRIGKQQRVLTIGTHGAPWTPEQARDRAAAALSAIANGEDPSSDKQAARAALTVTELIDLYLTDGPATKPAKRATAWEADRSKLRSHIEPLIGKKRASLVTKADAARCIHDITTGKTARTEKTKARGVRRITGGEGTARRTRLSATAMWNWGLEHKHIGGENPFASVRLTAPVPKERFLSDLEAGALLDALTDLEAAKTLRPAFADIIRLLLLTGARKGEIMGLQWREVDLARAQIVLPPERTKSGGKNGVRRVHLSPAALEIFQRRLKAADGQADGFIFPAGRGAEGHATGLRRPFLAACKRAKITGLRVHDLRHSFASFAIADGASLPLIAKLLGHASARTSERYAHLSGDPMQDAVASIGRRFTQRAEPPPSDTPPESEPAATGDQAAQAGNVIPLNARR
jgi:integrase